MKNFFKTKGFLTLLFALVALGGFGYMASQNFFKADETNKNIGKQEEKYVPGRLLVKFRPEVPKGKADKILKDYGVTETKELDKIGVKVIQLPAKASEKAYLNAFKNRKEVELVDLDRMYAPQEITPNDPYWMYQTFADNAMNLPTAWVTTTGSPSTIIAILDTGVNGQHEDLAANIVSGWNAYDNNSDTHDVLAHGTDAAGAAAAVGNNGKGVAGVNWNSKIMPMRISDAEGYANASTAATGLVWAADHGARVANISYGMSNSEMLAPAAQYFRSKGGVITVSSGNSGYVDPSPDDLNVLTIGAADVSKAIYPWSNTGNNLDLVTPGMAWTVQYANGGSYYGAAGGTSIAAPMAAGVAALVVSANPSLTADQIENILKQNTDDLGTPGWDTTYGFGFVNAAKAVAAAGGTPPPSDTVNPVTTITTPANNATVSSIISPVVKVTDNTAANTATLTLDGTTNLTLTDTQAVSASEKNFTFSLDTTLISNGSHTLLAKGYDNANNSSTQTITINVNNAPAADTTAPTTSISSPANGATISATATISASATDNVAVTQVDFFANGLVIGSDNSSPYSISWDTTKVSNGSYTLTTKAYDAAGNIGTSTAKTVTVNNTVVTPDTTAPTVSITAPANNSKLSTKGNTTVKVTASDNIAVTKTELYLDGKFVASGTTGSLSYALNPKKLATGLHLLTAKAYDAAGNSATSLTVTVTK